MTHTTNTPVPANVLIPAELASRIADALGRFISDEGWGQTDMDTSDDLAAALAAPVAAQPDLTDAYEGAREDLAIWKRRAIEADRKRQTDWHQIADERAAEIVRLNDLLDRQRRGEPVAYLDLGVGGYMDVGTDLTDEQLAALPKGRHMLGIIGTYGVDGYREVAPQPAEPVAKWLANMRPMDAVESRAAYEAYQQMVDAAPVAAQPREALTEVMELDRWRNALVGLCDTDRIETPEQAVANVKARMRRVSAPVVQQPDLIRFDFINADGRPDSKMITHNEMRERYATLSQQPVSGTDGLPQTIEKMAINRYRPVPSGAFAYKVVGGDGARSLFSGTRDKCQVIARKLTEAFLDGAHVALQEHPAQPQPSGNAGELPTNEEFETLWEEHAGHPADFAAAVLERWGGWQAGALGYGGSLSAGARSSGNPGDLPDSLIPATPDLDYLRSMTAGTSLPAMLRGNILAAVRWIEAAHKGR